MKKTLFDDAGRSLKEYRRKRDFAKTAEPSPRAGKKSGTKPLLFVIQKHDATRLHYDFRLEMEGVLKSWAVPKGLPTTRGDRRLAVQVEDHPFDYARFEGTIPEGNYGAGTVMVWDIGVYSVQGGNPLQSFREGKLHLTLKGKKLQGDFTFVRMKSRPGDTKDNWLIFKSGTDSKPISAKKEDESVLTGRSMRTIAGENTAQWQSHRVVSKKAVPSKIAQAVERKKQASGTRVQKTAVTTAPARWVEPMKCKLVPHPPEGDKWIYEIKFDGFRTLALKNGDEVQLLSRSNKPLHDRFPKIVEAVRKLPFARGILDGEIVALDEEGRSSFQLLQMANMPGQARAPLVFYVFDLLNLEGRDLKNLSLQKRKQLLQTKLGQEHEPIRLSSNIHGDPRRLLEEIRKRGLEGMIAKNVNSSYETGRRSGAWQKIKVVNEQEFVIGGFTEPKGSRDHFGAVLVGFFEKGKLIFASKVGSGFNQALLDSLYRQFQKLKQSGCPFANLPQKRDRYGGGVTAAEMKRCTWIEPRLVAQIRFSEWTRDNHLRQPVFLGLREDLNPEDVGKEKPA